MHGRAAALDVGLVHRHLCRSRFLVLLLGGMSTEGCVAQTAIDARERGFKVSVLAEACATIDERVEHIALEYLEAVAGAQIVSS